MTKDEAGAAAVALSDLVDDALALPIQAFWRSPPREWAVLARLTDGTLSKFDTPDEVRAWLHEHRSPLVPLVPPP